MGIKVKNQRIPALLLALFLLAFTQQPAAMAHTKLLIANPDIASQIDSWPASVTLEFDEELQNLGDEKANFVVVNNAVGDQVSETDEVIFNFDSHIDTLSTLLSRYLQMQIVCINIDTCIFQTDLLICLPLPLLQLPQL